MVTAYIVNKAKHKRKAASCVIKKGGFPPLFFLLNAVIVVIEKYITRNKQEAGDERMPKQSTTEVEK